LYIDFHAQAFDAGTNGGADLGRVFPHSGREDKGINPAHRHRESSDGLPNPARVNRQASRA
jgi:hypothetical protein